MRGKGMGIVAVSLAVVVLAGAAAAGAGALRWRRETAALRARLEQARAAPSPARYEAGRELPGLPPPVQRFFRAALRDGQPLVSAARLRHRGTFLTGEASGRWSPFRSDQLVVTRRPGFDWDARIRMAPGVHAFVHDAYVAGEGVLHAAALGLVTVAEQRGTPEVARGELLRWLAEAAWYPTALLPSQGVRWEPVDATSARATLVDGAVTASVEFGFGADGLIDSVRALRHRTVEGGVEERPWRGRFWEYAERGGMRVPLAGEVEWLLPAGPSPYWRGRVVEISHELAP